ncbi:hypothetical protein ABPG74_006514 [Tetrahymena malaccensis]
MIKKNNKINYTKYQLIEKPQKIYPYHDKDGYEYYIDKLGVLIYNNNVISDEYLQSKFGKIELDLYCDQNLTHYIYKGMNTTAKNLKKSSAKIAINLYHDFVQGFPLTINDVKLTDKTEKIVKIFSKIRKNIIIEKLMWEGEDILEYQGTFQELFLQNKMLLNEETNQYELDIDCEVKLTQFTPISKDADKYKYFFASFDIYEDILCNRLIYTLRENWDGFITYLGFGAYDKFRGQIQLTYEEAVEQVIDLLYERKVKQSEIQRLSFKKIELSDKDASKFAIEIGIQNTKRSRKSKKQKEIEQQSNITTQSTLDN